MAAAVAAVVVSPRSTPGERRNLCPCPPEMIAGGADGVEGGACCVDRQPLGGGGLRGLPFAVGHRRLMPTATRRVGFSLTQNAHRPCLAPPPRWGGEEGAAGRPGAAGTGVGACV